MAVLYTGVHFAPTKLTDVPASEDQETTCWVRFMVKCDSKIQLQQVMDLLQQCDCQA